MVAKALLDELTYGAVSRRERPVASHIPYTRHVDDHVIKTRDGLVMTILKCEGYSFETADISEINSRLLARNDLVRTLANSRFALVSHIIRREVQPRIASSFDNALCREIDERYDAALSQRRMFVNDLYLTIVRRPLQGQAGTFDAMLTKLLGRKDAAGESVASQTALSELHDASTAVREILAAYGARQLGVVRRDGVWHSEPLEFLVQLVNGGIPRPMHLPRMALADALSMGFAHEPLENGRVGKPT
jgi:type IV secretion system protein VirB4